jgi:hypothetical protein
MKGFLVYAIRVKLDNFKNRRTNIFRFKYTKIVASKRAIAISS